MSFDKYNMLYERCSICKDCGATEDDCNSCETRRLICAYECEQEEHKDELDFGCEDKESGDLETVFGRLLNNP